MKNLLTIALVVFLAGAFTSCKKDYTCTCDITVLGITQTVEETFMDVSKSEANDLCDAAQTDAAAGGGGLITVNCSLD